MKRHTLGQRMAKGKARQQPISATQTSTALMMTSAVTVSIFVFVVAFLIKNAVHRRFRFLWLFKNTTTRGRLPDADEK